LDHDPYGLSDRPFQLTPDPRFYFESATHRKAMTYLGYGLAQGEGFIVITGDPGTGKTMLVGRLMATIDRSRLTAINLVSTQLEGEDILRVVAFALGIAADVDAKGQLLARIERFLYDQKRNGRRTLLIVDEAQNLSASALEELRMLSNFQVNGQALLQIFLLGQPEFRQALAEPRFEQLRQRIIATHHLTAMNPDEAAPYVMHRLACAGWKGTPRFTPDAHEAFYRLSGGIPRRLNMLAGRVMLQGAIERLGEINGEVVEEVAADLATESGVPVPPASEAAVTTSRDLSAPGGDRAAEEDLFAALPSDIPPPTIEQPPRYDGLAPAQHAPRSGAVLTSARYTVEPDPAPAPAPVPAPAPAPAPGLPPVAPAASYARFSVEPEDDGEASPPPAGQSEAAAAKRPEPAPPSDSEARCAELEARLAEQEEILRRTFALLVELVETDPTFAVEVGESRGAA